MKSVTLPNLPKDISPKIKEQKYVKFDIEKPELHSVEKVGDRLMKYQKCSETGFDKYYEVKGEDENEEYIDDSDYEEESPELLKLDPYKWKSQDHYAVLGLSKLRINATEEDIKKAYRKKVLRHHPDKKASDGNTNNDSFFKCIQKAYEIITDPVKRRQFDSVDPEFDESIPTKCSKENFFEVLTPVFERNARFSNIQPVPSLGDMNSTREEVEEFYRFWTNFDSWRSFEYLDEEDADSYENREDRRYYERKNKNARAKHKKEDNQRIINLIDLAVRTDPRLALYRKADRESKEAKRLEKKAAQIAAANEEKKRKEEEEKAKERAIREEEERIAREKKEKEMKKRVVRKEKKTLKKFLQDNNYLIDPATPATPEQIDDQLKKLDGYVSQMDADNLTAYRVYLMRAFENGWESASNYFNEENHLNEGEKYAEELAAKAPVEEVKKEVKIEPVNEPVADEKKEIEKVENIEEEKEEPKVKKPEIVNLLKKLPSISRIGGMRRTKKKVIRKEYDSEEENEKEKEENAPATPSKRKNKKKKKSKKKNNSEENKDNAEESVATEEAKDVNTEESVVTEEVKENINEEVVSPAKELIQTVEQNTIVKEIKEEITPVVTDEIKNETIEVRGMYKVKPIYGEVPEIDTKTKMYNVKSIYGDNVIVDLPLTASQRLGQDESEIVKTVEFVEEIKNKSEVTDEKPIVVETTDNIIENNIEVVLEKEIPVEVKPVIIENEEIKVEAEAPVEDKPEIKKSKKMKKKKSKAKFAEVKPKEEVKEEKKEEKKIEKKLEIIKSKEEILKEVKKQEEENAKRIKDILKKKISMGKLRLKKSNRKLREDKKEDEKENEKEELTISFKDDRKKTKAERKAEKEAKKAAKKNEKQEQVETEKIESEEKVKVAENNEKEKEEEKVTIVQETEDKTEVEENSEEVEEKTEISGELSEDKTEIIEEKSEIIEVPVTEGEEKIEVETIVLKEPAKEEKTEVLEEKKIENIKATQTKTKNVRHCPSGISLKPWTSEQQTKLEEALNKFPSSQFKENPMERWYEISNYVGRSRTDIKFRIKDLAESVRRKKSKTNLSLQN